MRPPVAISGFRLGPCPAVTAWALDGSVEESQICEMPVSLPLAGSLVDWNTINDPVRLSDELLLVPCPRLTWTSPPLASRK